MTSILRGDPSGSHIFPVTGKKRHRQAILQTTSLFVAVEHRCFGGNNRAPSVMNGERFVAAELYCSLQDRQRRAVLNLQSTQVLESMI